LKKSELKNLLDQKYLEYNNLNFIDSDPVSIPHRFSLKQDIEISGFLAATISWGQRITIIKNANKIIHFMDEAPFDFIKNSSEKDLLKFQKFVHRTFNGEDCMFFVDTLKKVYSKHNSLEDLFYHPNGVKAGLVKFREEFLKFPHLTRTEKHLANPLKNSSAKRLNMYLRWMVRKDDGNVDFGIWNKIKTKDLFLPLDVHTANVGRKLGLLARKQNDWKAVDELTTTLKQFDSNDPVKYDYALFGLGIFEKY
jgi:uncharacterized protein (TIGR02757 family)